MRPNRVAFRGIVFATISGLAAAAGWAAPPAGRAALVPRLRDLELQQQQQIVRVVVHADQIAGIQPGPQFFPQSVASGDPRPDSVILWTRVDDADFAAADVPVRVIVTTDKYFSQIVMNQVVPAQAAYDHCVKLKIPGLQPGTTYLYFFVYAKGGTLYLSRLGRTKTAPAPGTDVPVRFAFVSCQDYNGRYYNTYLKLLLDHKDDLDFLVHLGDYIYETTTATTPASAAGKREVVFSDLAGAIPLGTADAPLYAAASLSNYRDLYKTYRTDPILQQLHESYAMIATWDDHEFSDDCWGATGTYFSGRKSETDPVRRRNAERAYFEYMPIDYGLDASGQLAISDAILYPNAKIYRAFSYGKNVQLVMTDYRSFRPDHVVPEDAFPGKVVLDKPTLQLVLGAAGYDAVKGSLDPYVPIDGNPALQAGLAAILYQYYLLSNPFITVADATLRAQAAATGNVSATYINALFTTVGYPTPLDDTTISYLDRGLSYLYVGKQDLYSQIGARYVLAKPSFDLLSGVLYQATGGASEDAYGPAQRAWIQDTLTHSSATWKIYGSSTSATPMIVDFTNPIIASFLPPGFPDAFRTQLLLDADEWDGFPHARQQLLGLLAEVPGSVIISGDIHASFVADHGNGLYEFTGSSVSSQTFGDEVLDEARGVPQLANLPGLENLVALLPQLLQLSTANPQTGVPQILYDDTRGQGYVVMEASSSDLVASYFTIDPSQIGTSYYANPGALGSLFEVHRFRLSNGTLTPLP
jgi:alkaline phosphatase D